MLTYCVSRDKIEIADLIVGNIAGLMDNFPHDDNDIRKCSLFRLARMGYEPIFVKLAENGYHFVRRSQGMDLLSYCIE